MANISVSGNPYHAGGEVPSKGNGMDPLILASIATSLFGSLFGGSDQQERKAYSGRVSPQNTLQDAMDAIKSFGSGLEQRGPARLRSFVPPPPEPIRIPGLDFQIGGGLGMDPALKDPSMLQGRGMGMGSGPGPFASTQTSGPLVPGQRGNPVVSRSPAQPTPVQYRKPKESF